MTSPGSRTTELLADARRGDARAADVLLPLVYDELRRLAQHFLGVERANHTLQATALVNEAYLKLVDQSRAEWRDELHFKVVAAQAIRRILVDHARSHGRLKRGGGRARVALRTDLVEGPSGVVDLVEIDELLRRLAEAEPRAAEVIELRFFGGLTVEETATHLDISVSSVEREWRFARAWLYDAIEGDGRE